MINLLYNIGQVLGITIVHSLWQGLLIYFVLRLIFSSAPMLSSAKKYNFSTVGLVGMAGWFIYTFCVQAYAYDWNRQPWYMPRQMWRHYSKKYRLWLVGLILKPLFTIP